MKFEEKQRFQRIRACFEEAIQHSEGLDREQFLNQACAGDQEMLAEVQRILESYAALSPRLGSSWPRFGPYQVIGVVGRGGMGTVYEAVRADLAPGQPPAAAAADHRVAVKVIGDGAFASFLSESLRREHEILKGLHHPCIARLFDGGATESGDHYLITEFIDGMPLDRYCEEHSLTATQRLALFLTVLDAVGYAHSTGVVHRDLKPANILVTADGQIKLVDFGSARPLHSGNTDSLFTRAFTLGYSSPEMQTGAKTDERADIYSLGVLYGNLLGSHAKPAIIHKATAHQPGLRYATVAQFREALTGGVPSRKRVWVLGGAAAIAIVAIAAFALSTRHPRPALLQPHRINPPRQNWKDPAISPDGKWLAVAWDGQTGSGSGHTGIWLSESGGSNPRLVIDDPVSASQPAFSPDLASIAFRSERQPPGIYEFDRATRRTKLLIANGRLPSYSPDGRWLLYTVADNDADPSRKIVNPWWVVPLGVGKPKPIGTGLTAIATAFWASDGSVLMQETHPDSWGIFRVWAEDPNSDAPPRLLAESESGDLRFNGLRMCGFDSNKRDLLAWAGKPNRVVRISLLHKLLRPSDIQTVAELHGGSALGCRLESNGSIWIQATSRSIARYLYSGSGGLQKRSGPNAGTQEFFLSASADGGELYTSGGHLTWVPPSKEPKVIPGRTAGVLSGDGKTVWTQRWLDEYRTDLQRWQWGENNPHYETAIRGIIWSTSFDGTGILGMVQGVPMRNVRLLEIGAQKQSDIRLLQHPRWNLYRAYFSPDSQWVAFTAVKEDESRWLMLAPFRTVGAVPPEDWIEIAEGVSHQFSSDGNALYFLSGRDGFGCIYVVHLDPNTKRPAGPPKAVLHLHGNGPNAQSMPASAFRIGVSKLGLHFSLGEEETQVVHYQ